MKIVLATHNKGKIREFREALAEIGWEAEPVSDVADLLIRTKRGRLLKKTRSRRRGTILPPSMRRCCPMIPVSSRTH